MAIAMGIQPPRSERLQCWQTARVLVAVVIDAQESPKERTLPLFVQALKLAAPSVRRGNAEQGEHFATHAHSFPAN